MPTAHRYMGAEGGRYTNNKDYILTVRWINGSGPVLYSIGPPFLERERKEREKDYILGVPPRGRTPPKGCVNLSEPL